MIITINFAKDLLGYLSSNKNTQIKKVKKVKK